MNEDWRLRLLYREDGTIKPKLANNFYWFIKGHPEMAGVFAMPGAVWLVSPPPWEKFGPFCARVLEKTDITHTRIWLEQHGLRPSTRETADVIAAVAESNR